MTGIMIGLCITTLILTAVNYWIFTSIKDCEVRMLSSFAEYMTQTVENVRKELMKHARRNKKR